MNDTITATHQDPALASIRNKVKRKDAVTPFLLLPVRIESRFMKGDKPIISNVPTEPFDFLKALLAANHKLQIAPDWNKLNIRTIEAILDEDLEILEGLRDAARLVNEVNALQEKRLQKESDRFAKDSKNYLQKLKAFEKSSDSAQRWSERIKKLNDTVKQIKPELTSIGLLAEDRYQGFEGVLEKLRTANGRLEDLKTLEFHVTDSKDKRELYTKLDGAFKSIESTYYHTNNLHRQEFEVKSKQVTELKEIRDALTATWNSLEPHLETIHSPYHKARYKNRVSNLMKRHQNVLGRKLENILIPKLDFQLALKKTSAEEIVYEVLQALYQLQAINNDPPKKYADVKSSRVKIYEVLHTLRASIHTVVKGNPDQFNEIRTHYEAVDREITTYLKSVKKVKGKDRYEKAGLTRTATHLNEEYREDLKFLKRNYKPTVPVLKNEHYTASAIALKKMGDQLESMKKRVDTYRKALPKDREESGKLLQDLTAFGMTYARESQKVFVMPYSQFKTVAGTFEQLKGDFHAAFLEQPKFRFQPRFERPTPKQNNPFKTPALKEAEQAVNALEKAVQTQVTDVADVEDRFYDDFRKEVVFEIETETEDQLWVRIYPDDVAVHTHEEKLTAQEAEAGREYWREITRAGNDQDLRLGAWRAIVRAYGPQRAAWIVKQLTPLPPASNTPNPYGDIFDLLDLQQSLLDQVEAAHNMLANGDEGAEMAFNQLQNDLLDLETSASSVSQASGSQLQRIHSQNTQLHHALEQLVQLRNTLGGQLSPELVNAVSMLDQSIATFGNLQPELGNIFDETQTFNPENPSIAAAFLNFPEVAIKESSWTEAPHSRVMPDRFVVIAMKGSRFEHIKVGKKIPTNLKLGVDPNKFNTDAFKHDARGDLIVDPAIKWMTDYPTAVQKGMGVTLSITPGQAHRGFDRLIVLGIREGDEVDNQSALEELLQNHHFIDEGMSVLPIGTPTNNTETVPSGFLSEDDDDATTFKVERNNEYPLPSPPVDSDGAILANALGIDYQAHLQTVAHHDKTEVKDAKTFNKAMAPATLVQFMEDVLDTMFTQDNIKRTRKWFEEYVVARGHVPSIRLGTQPYGIIPAISLSRFQATDNDENIPTLIKPSGDGTFTRADQVTNEARNKTRFAIRLKKLLQLLNQEFTWVQENHVKNSYNTDKDSPQKHFMEMLGLTATSVTSHLRYNVNVSGKRHENGDSGYNVNFNPRDRRGPGGFRNLFLDLIMEGEYFWSDTFADQHLPPDPDPDVQRGKVINRINNMVNDARIYSTRHLRNETTLVGPRITLHETINDPAPALQAEQEINAYVNWLVSQTPHNLWNSNDAKALPSKTLLFMLLRQALLMEYRTVSYQILNNQGWLKENIWKEMGQARFFFSFNTAVGNTRFNTKWRYLLGSIADAKLSNPHVEHHAFYIDTLNGGSRSLADYLKNSDDLLNGHRDEFSKITALKEEIEKLKAFSTDQLDQLLSEHLDLVTYRLDAWIQGLAYQRLETMRESKSNGIYLGSFGYVEKVRRGAPRTPVADLPEGLAIPADGPIYEDGDNQGFIHAPSLAHATMAAVLRAGYISNEATEDINNRLAVNLTSERVRMALALLEGVRKGQDVAAILGFMLERGLHERHPGLELNKYIYVLRERYPLVQEVNSGINGEEATYSSNVIHGVDLLEEIRQVTDPLQYPADTKHESLFEVLTKGGFEHCPAYLKNMVEGPSVHEQERALTAIITEIDRMASAMDALGDLALSESVYQVVRGNHVRAGAVLQALAEGKLPPEFQVQNTPRTGSVVTHKVGLRLKAIDGAAITIGDHPSEANLETRLTNAGARSTGWTSTFTPRAFASPGLNHWLGDVLGNPQNIRALVRYTTDDPEPVEQTFEVSLAELQRQPIDLLYLLGEQQEQGVSTLDLMVVQTVVTRESIADQASDQFTISYRQRDPNWTPDVKSFNEVAALIDTLRKTIQGASSMAADDFIRPGEAVTHNDLIKQQDHAELKVRLEDALLRLKAYQTTINAFIANDINHDNLQEATFTADQRGRAADILWIANGFGISALLPQVFDAPDDITARNYVSSMHQVIKGVNQKVGKVESLIAATLPALSADVKVAQYTEGLKTIFGQAFPVFTQFTLRNADAVKTTLELPRESGLLREAQPFAMDGWLKGMANVREQMSNLDLTAILSEAIDYELPELDVLQFPLAKDENGNLTDHWCGLPFPDGYAPDDDKFSVVLLDTGSMADDAANNHLVLMVDEWMEIIPSKDETTGVVFNYDQPNAMAPNAMLLALPSRLTENGKWDWDDLVHTIIETVDLAKKPRSRT